MEGCVLWQVLDMQIWFVDDRCQYLFMEMGVAYGDFSSELGPALHQVLREYLEAERDILHVLSMS